MRCTILILFLALYGTGFAQDPRFYRDFTELTDSKPVDKQAWEKCTLPVYASWGSTDIRYSKTNVPDIKRESRTWKGTVWRGERCNAQAVVWSPAGVENIKVVAGALKASGGNIIPASAIRTNFVRYVMTDELNKDKKGTCGYRPDRTKFDSSIVADILDVKTEHLIKARNTQPVWVNIRVPENTKPGIYRGKIDFVCDRFTVPSLEIELKVSDRVLLVPREWSFVLDLWQNPYAVARYHNLPLWSEAHFDAMRPMMKQLADAGQKNITATIMNEPWGGQTEDHFGAMVMRIKRLDGSWTFDYAVFDRWVEFMMSMGIDRQINCYSMIPWKLSFPYFDQAADAIRFVEAKPGSSQFREYWQPFLVDFARHLKEKGWFEIATIAMDERPMDQMQQVIRLVKESDPGYKIALAGSYHTELESDLYDYCIASKELFPDKVLAERKARGFVSTYYTCCSEPYPNTFTFSSPAESAWLGWYAAAKGFEGYLRWAYNSWVKEPLTDSRFRAFGAGDCYLIYPAGRSSVRMERLVEGIQDFEKVRILRETYKNNPAKLKALDRILSEFAISRLAKEPAAGMVNKARESLNRL